ncbi:MAG: ABC transporter ATP-binding protein [Saccharofermentanales bacterium]|jgi:oligopeptide transport system ATP-binding protein
MNNDILLKIENLFVSFSTYAGKVQAVRGANLVIHKGEIVAVVGESGCGKSVMAQSILQLNPSPPCTIDQGSILFQNEDLLQMNQRSIRKIRGKHIGIIFQDPMTSLDPTKQIGYQIIEGIRRHESIPKQKAYNKAADMLCSVGIANPVARMKQYPHEFSGGMRQRVMIASSLVCNPELLIADEPTTALDVTIQAQILDLLLKMQIETKTSIMLITHDMGVVADVADRVNIMYAGIILESGLINEIFYDAKHPYTWGLLNSIPTPQRRSERLVPIEGSPPDLLNPPVGCPFAERCDYAMRVCYEQMPEVSHISDDHQVLCWLMHPDAPTVVRPMPEERGDA